MMDAMATAVDWLEAYRDGDVTTLMSLYATDAVIECGCDGTQIISGPTALRAYWEQRIKDRPATTLSDLRPERDGASISYRAKEGKVGAVMEFGKDGRIVHQRCGPLSPSAGGCQ